VIGVQKRRKSKMKTKIKKRIKSRIKIKSRKSRLASQECWFKRNSTRQDDKATAAI